MSFVVLQKKLLGREVSLIILTASLEKWAPIAKYWSEAATSIWICRRMESRQGRCIVIHSLGMLTGLTWPERINK
jgi:hypothetical protein